MQESRQIYHQYLRQTKSTLPSLLEASLGYEDAMNLREALSHSHINHDAARCATCLAAQMAGREGDLQGPKLEDLQMGGREGDVQGPKLKHLPPVLAAKVVGREGDVQGTKLGDAPPELPPLRTLSPLIGGLDMWKWEGDNSK